MLLTELPGWLSLATRSKSIADMHLADLLEDESRQKALAFSNLENFYIDFSKQRITPEILHDLVLLAEQAGIKDRIQELLSGEIVNPSENRPALHTALRALDSDSCFLTDKTLNKKISKALRKMQSLIKRIHAGQWRGFSGKPIRDVVNIGVGGSDLGPLMTCFALDEFADPAGSNIRVHFASSIDGAQLAGLLPKLNPETTMFCIVSKSFTTIDTLSNAATALSWLGLRCDSVDSLKRLHFVGISTSPDKMKEWGICDSNQLQFWDWVGGRYSMWSTVGFSIALRIGMDGFREFLLGAHKVDKHLATTETNKNVPLLLALIDVWNCNFLSINAHAILPYDGRLKHLPAYLGQLEMESNGKSVSLQQKLIEYRTCPILWGEVGPNAQHAFYQLLHQGTEFVNSDFIIAKNRKAGASEEVEKAFDEHHHLNISNCLAQSRVLALGNKAMTEDEISNSSGFQQYAGNQSSTSIVIEQLTPETLGSLIALYEHKVFVSSVIWDINPFDQWGVELGKQIATKIQPILEGQSTDGLDSSTTALINAIRED